MADESATQYTRIDAAARRPGFRSAAAAVIACTALFSCAALFAGNARALPAIALSKAASPIPHTGEYCTGSGAQSYSKGTLKRIVDRTVLGLLEPSAHEPKFEASDVIKVGDSLFVVCDSSWDILKLDERLPLFSPDNKPLAPDASFSPPDEDSGFEALMHDASSAGDFYVIRESIESRSAHGKSEGYSAQILKVHLSEAGYSVEETCASEFRFEGDSKGFEGGVSLRGKDGVLYLLGLCEGNFCSESRGKEVGNGRVVVMARQDAAGGCVWKTVTTLGLPTSVAFVDYSAIAIDHNTHSVAITSQENSQLWVGSLSGGADGAFEPEQAAFGEGTTFDFPRSDGCEAIYCNVEGIHWVSQAADGSSAPGTLVAVSDKMKSKGRQPAVCQDKDQSVHLFALP